MNLLTFLFRLPLLPVRSFVKLASAISDEAVQQMADPAKIRHELERAEMARQSGEISDQQAAEFQDEAFAEFARARRVTKAAPGDRG